MTLVRPASDLPLVEREKAFLSYWDRLRGDRAFPERAEITPEDLRQWLGWVHVLEVLDGGRDFVYRIHGTEASSLTGTLQHRKKVSDWGSPIRERATELYGLAASGARPLFMCESEVHGQPRHWILSRVIVPFGDAGTHLPTHLLSLLTQHEEAWDLDPTLIEPIDVDGKS